MDAFSISSPAKPEQAGSERHASEHGQRHPPLRNRDAVVGVELLDVVGVQNDDEGDPKRNTYDHSNVWQACDSQTETVDSLKYQGVCSQ